MDAEYKNISHLKPFSGVEVRMVGEESGGLLDNLEDVNQLLEDDLKENIKVQNNFRNCRISFSYNDFREILFQNHIVLRNLCC